ncbi:amylo-alpha-1,6-glucosidase [Geomonas sp.]|uniref:amylo-alpha-1,6-glucosidase n=1 Tax=Geomonas sp. TaxID=2651584 RepID=UPI002B46D299|nr:glycoside hydrolase 100 family protein [Geomonas sp.]HJV33689.1 glycoside hydrolase 100 family protein [Geomonas sp.]
MPVPDNQLMEECYRRALVLLRENSTDGGVLASAINKKSVGRHYASIFGRDASICALGMAVSGDADLIDSARRGLFTLAKYQAPNGQIPKYVKPESGEVDFWYAGCIDATLWWLVAISLLDRWDPKGALRKQLETEVGLALRWLECQEHQVWHLLQQGEASDWADIMPRSGFVLYTNALWYWTKMLYDIPTAPHTRDYFNLLFWPFGRVVAEHRRVRLLMHYIRNRSKRTPFYLSFVNFATWGEEIDVFGNILAFLVGACSISGACQAVSRLTRMKANQPYPIRVVANPIGPQNPLWRVYMQRHRQNLAWQYHNGGIWPFVGGFWVILLARLGQVKEAWAELEKFAQASRINDWEFNEWLQGETGEPMGMARQSWNAALYILAYRTLQDRARYLP